MEKLVVSNLKLGILGGGQLGKMLSLAAGNWNVRTCILDLDDEMPASSACQEFTVGDFRDEETVLRFGRMSDVLTIEIEQVNIAALKRLRSEGKKVFPEPEVLETIQDKLLQNEWFASNGFPHSGFSSYTNAEEIKMAANQGLIKFPFVQKSRRFGYDGKGVAVVRNAQELPKLLDCPSVVEDYIEIEKEISVIVCRNNLGEIKVYDPVEMVFDSNANLVDYLLCPADISSDLALEAQQMASDIIERLQMTGILAVEMFLDSVGKLWINEMAPRPHNSGHHTIESCITSQYEQHLRAIFGFPLGSTRIKIPSLMLNLLGEPGYEGPVIYEGLTECLAIEGVKIHIYGKKQTKPYRKMGHVTILDSNRESALKKAEFIKRKLKVIA